MIIKYNLKLDKVFVIIVENQFTVIQVNLRIKVEYKIALYHKIEKTKKYFNMVVFLEDLTFYYQNKYSKKKLKQL